MPFTKPVVIIDNGRFCTKAGFSCDNHPVSMFRTLIGRPAELKGRYGREPYEVLVGNESQETVLDYELFTPVMNGRIVHWDNMERIWHHVFYRELRVAPEDRAVLLACTPCTPLKDKTRCCEVFFETLNSPTLCVQPTPVLAMYGSGTTTGIVVDIGHDSTEISPVYEGGMVRYAHKTTGLAGEQISRFIKLSLESRDIQYERHINHEIVENIKKNFIYVTPNFSMPSNKYNLMYKMPNGKKFLVRNEALLAGELFFSPEKIDCSGIKSITSINLSNPQSLPSVVCAAVQKCDPELQDSLWKAVVLCGGFAAVPGLADRLQKEIEKIIQRPINIIKSQEPYAVPWLGGAIFTVLPDANNIFVSKKQFEEQGEKIVRNRYI